MRGDLRYVRLRCPTCNVVSPTCDQQVDVRRSALSDWWRTHQRMHVPEPLIEAVDAEGNVTHIGGIREPHK